MKHQNFRRALCLLLSIVLLTGLLTGCGERGGRDSKKSASSRTEERKESSRRDTAKEEKKEEKRVEKKEEAPRETEKPRKKDNELPSFLDFDTSGKYYVSQYDVHDDYFTIVYKSDTDDVVGIAEDFIQQALDEGWDVVNEHEKDRKDWRCYKILLDHPESVTKQRLDVLEFYDFKGDVLMKINHYKDDGDITFSIDFVKGLESPDSDGAPGGGGGGSDLFGKDCTWCGGDGRCNECGGDGRVYNWLPGTTKYVDQNCTNCNMGRCRQCGGDGKD